VRGSVEQLPDPESDEYFASRDRDSQVGAWASPQSEPLPDREALDERAREAEGRFAGADIPRPSFWGGFVVSPTEIEFWQGQVARLHDRFRYLRTDAGWQLERLAP
jgi:pyridoxamine 5'-phosphate oxidase